MPIIFRKKEAVKEAVKGSLNINQVAVLGSGIMGCGITIALAQADLPVILWTRQEEIRARRKIGAALQQMDSPPDKEEMERICSNIYVTTELNLIAESDLVIEAVVEDLAVKKQLFTTLSHLCTPPTILATNTSTFSVNEIALNTSYPERVVGMRFFNPIYQTPLVEVICGRHTSEETFSLVRELAAVIKKEVISVQDTPSFCGSC